MSTHEELAVEHADKLAELKSKHPGKRIRLIDTAAGVLACVNPSRPQFNLFQSQLWDDDKAINARAHENMLRACVVDPDPKTFAQWVDEYPGIMVDRNVIAEFKIVYGATKDASAKR